MSRRSSTDEAYLMKKKVSAEKEANVEKIINATEQLGNLYYSKMEFKKSLKEYKAFLDLIEQDKKANKKKYKDHKNLMEANSNILLGHRRISECLCEIFEFDDALKHQEIYLKGVKKIKDNYVEIQRAYATIGRLYYIKAKYLMDCDFASKFSKCLSDATLLALSKAKAAFFESQNIYESHLKNNADHFDIEARLQLNIGLVFQDEGNDKEGLNYIHKSKELCKKHSLAEELLFKSLMAIEASYEKSKQMDEAQNILNEAISTLKNPTLKCEAQFVLAELLLKIGSFQSSKNLLVQLHKNRNIRDSKQDSICDYLKTVIKITNLEKESKLEQNKIELMKKYEVLGDLTFSVGAVDSAVKFYKKMLSYARITKDKLKISSGLVSVYETLRENGQFQEAIEYIEEESKLFKTHEDSSKTFLALASTLINTQASSKKIKESLSKAYEHAKKSNNVLCEIEVVDELIDLCLEFEIDYFEDINKVKEENNRKKLSMPEKDNNNSKTNINLVEDINLEEIDFEDDFIGEPEIKRNKLLMQHIKKNNEGECDLHIACRKGDIEKVKLLLEVQRDTINIKDNKGMTPLQKAAGTGNTAVCDILIKAGANLNDHKDNTPAPLLIAAMGGYLSLVNFFVDNGADTLALSHDKKNVVNILENQQKLKKLPYYSQLLKKLKEKIPKKTKEPETQISHNKGQEIIILKKGKEEEDVEIMDLDNSKLSNSEIFTINLSSDED